MSKKIVHRGTLSPYKRSGERGFWTCRGTIPVRGASGITRRRIELGARDSYSSKAECQADCNRLNAYYEQLALDTTKRMTFAQAWQSYVDSGRPLPKYSERLLNTFGLMDVKDITNDVMIEKAKGFGIKRTPQTLKRHYYMPVVAILRMASKSRACDVPSFTMPDGYSEVRTHKRPPPDEWYKQVLPLLPIKLQALLVYLTIHGRRLGEALSIEWKDVDFDQGTIEVDKTKNGDRILVALHPMALSLIQGLDRKTKYVFGYKPTQYGGDAARKLLKEICDRHGIPYYSPHVLGRHAFARRMLKAGYSLQHVKDAGGWKTLSVLSSHYGHLASAETSRAVHHSAAPLVGLLESCAGDQLGMEIESEASEISRKP